MSTFIFFSFLAAIIIVPQYLRFRDRARLHETLRLAFERNQPVPPELMDALVSRKPVFDEETAEAIRARGQVPTGSALMIDRAERDLRRGVVWLAVGLGLVAMGAAFYFGLYNTGGSEETFGAFAASGSIPAFIGLAYLGLWFFGRRRNKV
jgi:drug/metabolite transporter (DMT)-like permease